MKKTIYIIAFAMAMFSSHSHSQSDPMGLSEYTIVEADSTGSNYHERRMTNHEVDLFRRSGAILPDGSFSADTNMLHYRPQAQGSGTTASSSTSPVKLQKKPLPTSQQIAQQTGTKHASHPDSKGTISVRPTNFPDNPTRDDIVRMQQHIQHIERTVGKALDLSLSAYAVAELPQATEGRSGVSIGMAANDGKAAEAVGFSSNFGDKHEYTIKISLSHSGHEDAIGAGFGWQW